MYLQLNKIFMNRKLLYSVLAGVVILIAGLLIYNQSRDNDVTAVPLNNNNDNQVEASNENSNTTSNTNTSANANANNSNTNEHFSNENDANGQGQVVAVNYDGTKFTPATITIKNGDTVVFKNLGSTNMWPASDPHPTHVNYPGFDSLKAVPPGGIFSFKFTKVGTWGYHNHLNPSQKGTIVVQ